MRVHCAWYVSAGAALAAVALLRVVTLRRFPRLAARRSPPRL